MILRQGFHDNPCKKKSTCDVFSEIARLLLRLLFSFCFLPMVFVAMESSFAFQPFVELNQHFSFSNHPTICKIVQLSNHLSFDYIPSLKLTWPLKMDSWKIDFLLGRPNFQGLSLLVLGSGPHFFRFQHDGN